MSDDFHERKYSDSTQVKLALFRKHLDGWMGVFARNPTAPKIGLFDFFAGPGTDATGQGGTPHLILSAVSGASAELRHHRTEALIYLNDNDPRKVESLKQFVGKFPDLPCIPLVRNLDFQAAFAEAKRLMAGRANLLILDQFGIQHFNAEVFRQVIQFPRTDVLVFVASSHARRFKDTPEIKTHMDLSEIASKGELGQHRNSHRLVLKWYREQVPAGKRYYLAPFSLRQPGGQIHGVCFGSGHPLGLEKFLDAAWKLDQQTGQANWDLDNDGPPDQLSLLPGEDQPKKLGRFETQLREHVTAGALKDTRAVYVWTLEAGCLPKHGRAVLEALKKDKRIDVDLKGFGRESFQKNVQPIKLLKT